MESPEIFRYPPAPDLVALEVDHRRPLWSLTDDERDDLDWWLLGNLQLLCPDCHKAKTKREAADRAALRRGDPLPDHTAAPTLF